MRYEYTVTKDSGEAELIKAMSWKKAIKKVLMLNAKFSGWITYINKKGNVQTKVLNNGKEVKWNMKEVNEAYKRWEKEKSEEAKAAWYEAVRRFSNGLNCAWIL